MTPDEKRCADDSPTLPTDPAGAAVPNDDASRRVTEPAANAAAGSDTECCMSKPVETQHELPAEAVAGAVTESRVLEELKKVVDPELFVNIVDLGLIYVVNIVDGEGDQKNVSIDMTMTSPACPAGPQLIAGSKNVVQQLDGVGEVEVRIVMEPPWTPDKMTEDAKDQLGIF
ncbi:MAG: metal-sulfur cluster assembly factor [Planctomycetales bacterium]|nr:metal-sulfur cluster assembly factor [Planctomycetales bacterium]